MYVYREDTAIAYEEAGSTGVPMVLVHGWGVDRSTLAPLLERLAVGRRVVSVDLRGFGESEAPYGDYSVATFADDIAFVIERLGLVAPVVVGHSLGALIALDLVARHSGVASAAVLLEGMVVAPAAVLAGLGAMRERVRAPAYREFMGGLMTHLAGPRLHEADRSRLVALARSCRQQVLAAALDGMLAFDSTAAAAAARCPLLYVGTGTTYSDLVRFRELCPMLESAALSDCGHYFPLEKPESVAALIERFCERSAPA